MRSTRSFPSAISAAVALALHSAAAHADLEGLNSFSIPPQSLSAALIQFSNQADVQVVGSTDTLANLDTNGVSGQLTGREALKKLLESHALRFEEVTNRSVKILPQALPETRTSRSADGSGRPLVLAQADPAQPPAAAPSDEPLHEVVIRGLNFKYNLVETANKMPLSVKDTPQSVKIITEDMLDFSGITSFEDVYKVDAGAHTSHAQDGFVRNYFRGFKLDSRNAVKLDGMRMPGVMVLDLAPFERFEVIKGATSTIYGQGLVAGTLNAVSKKPVADFGGALSIATGNYGHQRGDLDLHGALTGDGRLTGRVVAAYLDEDSYLDFAYMKHKVIAPSLKFEFSPDTSVTLLTQFQEQNFLQSYGFGVQIDGDPADPASYHIPDVPRSRLVALPTGGKESELMFSRLLLEHRFSDDWQLRANAQYASTEILANGSLGIVTDADGFTNMEMYYNEREAESYGGEINLFGNVEFFGREHTLFLGVDQIKDRGKKGLYAYASLPSYLTGFSIFNPDYSLLPTVPSSIHGYTMDNLPSDYTEFQNGKDYITESGVTAQALLRATDRLSFLLGARYTNVKQGDLGRCCDETVFEPLPSAYDTEWSNHATVGQVGVTFAITLNVNVYASAGETFMPRLQFTFDPGDPTGPGNRVGPEEGEAYEIGLKGEALGKQLAWSVAAFDIARTNISETDRVNGYPFVVLLGKQRSKGIELDVQGQILPGWDVYGSAAIMDNEFVEGDFTDYPSYTSPKSGISLFSSYEFQGGTLRGFGFGGGVVYKDRDKLRAFFGGAFTEPGDPKKYFQDLFEDVFEVDARVFYAREHWNLQLAATNLFDAKYYSPEDNNFYYAVGVNPGRQVIGKVSYRF